MGDFANGVDCRYRQLIGFRLGLLERSFGEVWHKGRGMSGLRNPFGRVSHRYNDVLEGFDGRCSEEWPSAMVLVSLYVKLDCTVRYDDNWFRRMCGEELKTNFEKLREETKKKK